MLRMRLVEGEVIAQTLTATRPLTAYNRSLEGDILVLNTGMEPRLHWPSCLSVWCALCCLHISAYKIWKYLKDERNASELPQWVSMLTAQLPDFGMDLSAIWPPSAQPKFLQKGQPADQNHTALSFCLGLNYFTWINGQQNVPVFFLMSFQTFSEFWKMSH